MWFIDNLTQSLITKYLITSNWKNRVTNKKKNKIYTKKTYITILDFKIERIIDTKSQIIPIGRAYGCVFRKLI